MAKFEIYKPFLLKAEGGYVDNIDDAGKETNKGITWATWQKYYGASSHDRFMAMDDSDWSTIMTNGYWNVIKADGINSQRIANAIADWFVNSGKYASEDAQIILDSLFGDHLLVDGCFGPQTIAAINLADEAIFYQDLLDKHKQFYLDIVDKNPTQQQFLRGWLNRIQSIEQFNASLT